MGQMAQTGRFVRRWWPVLLAIAVMAVITSFVGLMWVIQADAHRYALDVQQHYTGDEVQALIAAVQDEQRPLDARNRDVWALGRMADPRAVPVLTRYYTGKPCEHDKFLCQEELKKAIDLSSGRKAPPKWMRGALGMAPQAVSR